MRFALQSVVFTVILSFLAVPAGARQTVCTMTVNSADEREVFRKWLPADKFDFVELVGEAGDGDVSVPISGPVPGPVPRPVPHLCRQGVSCDVLVVSGHFAGREFYSSRPEATRTVKVEDLERAQCGQCPGMFANLKEVYLFGCDSLKAEPVASAMPEIVRGLERRGMSTAAARDLARMLSVRYGEASRDLMRRLFPGVPVIYGFASLAPYGRVAGPMLERYFAGAASIEVGSGRPSARLLSIFAPSSMAVEEGQQPGERDADFRAEACLAVDDSRPLAARIEQLHARLAAPMPQLRMAFTAAERFVAGWPEAASLGLEARRALDALVADAGARSRYLDTTRDTSDPALRVRMVSLARSIGWLDEAGVRAEHRRLALDLLAARDVGFSEVDLVCDLQGHGLSEGSWSKVGTASTASTLGQRAMLACLGEEGSRADVLRALASVDEADLHIARAYLRHRPLRDEAEARLVGLAVAHMASAPAQARALEGLARLGVSDRGVLDELLRLYARTGSASVQSAVAEVFFRTDRAAYDAGEVARVVRGHRRGPPGGMVDLLLRELEKPARSVQESGASSQMKTPEPS